MQATKMRQDFQSVMEARRSIRVLGAKEPITQTQLETIIGRTLQLTPTAFNAQEQRVVLLLGGRHTWFWNLVTQKLKFLVPAEKFPESAQKINGFIGGIGTILLYQDTSVIKGLQEQMPAYQDNFPRWAEQASGMLKYTLWTSLVAEGYGVSLQHYTELIEQEVNQALSINPAWKMMGQIPFGSPEETPEKNDILPLEQRMLVFD